MKIAMALTMDGLVRALRATAHRLADEIELDGAHAVPADRMDMMHPERRVAPGKRREADHDIAGG